MYIQPDGKLSLLAGINIDREYNYTLFFGSLSEQTDFFENYAERLNISDRVYQRKNSNSIRIKAVPELLYGCNYLMFQNSNYSNKWFYAFIDSIDYINANCAEITYSIDLIQTWYFDYRLGDCFIEREHTISDERNTIRLTDDIASVVRMKSISDQSKQYDKYALMIITDKLLCCYSRVGGDQATQIRPHSYFKPLNCDFNVGYFPAPISAYIGSYTPDVMYSGLPTNSYIYAFPITKLSDLSPYTISELVSVYNTGSEIMYADDFLARVSRTYTQVFIDYNKLATFIPGDRYVNQGDSAFVFTEGNFQLDDIIQAYVIPLDFLATDNRIKRSSELNIGNFTYSTAPRNNILYQSPYLDLVLEDYSGHSITLNPIGMDEYKLICEERFAPYPSFILYPKKYLGIQNKNIFVGTNLIVNSLVVGSSIGQYLAENQHTLQQKGISAALKLLTGIAIKGTMATISPTTALIPSEPINPAVGSVATQLLSQEEFYGYTPNKGDVKGRISPKAISGADTLWQMYAKIRDVTNYPNPVYKRDTGDSEDIASSTFGYRIYYEYPDDNSLKRIDDFFDRYGYKIMETKIPNIDKAKYDSETRSQIRKVWNYIKTTDCVVHREQSMNLAKGFSAQDEADIQTIYNNGITFWANNNDVGNYNDNRDNNMAGATPTPEPEPTTIMLDRYALGCDISIAQNNMTENDIRLLENNACKFVIARAGALYPEAGYEGHNVTFFPDTNFYNPINDPDDTEYDPNSEITDWKLAYFSTPFKGAYFPVYSLDDIDLDLAAEAFAHYIERWETLHQQTLTLPCYVDLEISAVNYMGDELGAKIKDFIERFRIYDENNHRVGIYSSYIAIEKLKAYDAQFFNNRDISWWETMWSTAEYNEPTVEQAVQKCYNTDEFVQFGGYMNWKNVLGYDVDKNMYIPAAGADYSFGNFEGEYYEQTI